MNRVAIYAGTFDPMTLGHLDLIERSAELFDKVIVAVASASSKRAFFSVEERVEMARDVVKDMDNVEAEMFDGLLVDYARRKAAPVLIRGLRAYSDFEWEFQLALTNRKLAPEIETLFMMPKESHSYVSSSTVREVASLGGDIRDFVPAAICDRVSRAMLNAESVNAFLREQ